MLIETRNLTKKYPIRAGGFVWSRKWFTAVDGVNILVHPGESLALVGESGCGKTTLARMILALERPTEGAVFFQGKNLNMLSSRELRAARKNIQVIFQDPFSSLNPRMNVEAIVSEPMIIHSSPPGRAQRREKTVSLLEAVGLSCGHMNRYPHEFSGGQRQRIGIARALALDPKIIIADEPVSALDVSIQAQILNLLKDLQKQYGLSYLFISHDLSVVRYLCNRIAVMYLGRIVETAPADRIFSNPQHPYTEALLSAVPVPDPSRQRSRRAIVLKEDVQVIPETDSGCNFRNRCRYAVKECAETIPPLEDVPAERSPQSPHSPHLSACHKIKEVR